MTAAPVDTILTTPRRFVVIGRRSVGKSTLVNALTDASAPTGLGGVTRVCTDYPTENHVLVDTPPIGSLERARVTLGPALDDAHAVLWVVDGLQPVTHTERTAVDELVPPGIPVDIVVSRADLIPDDIESVVARTRAMTDADNVIVANLRAFPDPRRLLHMRPTRVERTQLLSAWKQELASLRASKPLDRGELRKRLSLRTPVRTWIDQREHQPLDAWLDDTTDALTQLRDETIIKWAASTDLQRWAHALPALPTPPTWPTGPLDRIRLRASGSKGALRELRAAVTSWLVDCDVELSDFIEQATFDANEQAAFEQAESEILRELRQLGG